MSLYLGEQKVTPVDFIEKDVPKTRFGLEIDNLVGTIVNGQYVDSTVVPELLDLSDLSAVNVTNGVWVGRLAKPKAVDLTNVKTAQNMVSAFAENGNLTAVNMPSLETAGKMDSAFQDCPNISSVSLPNLREVQSMKYAFYNNTNLRGRVSFDSLSSITMNDVSLDHLLWGCNNVSCVSFPALKSINTSRQVFRGGLPDTGVELDVRFDALETLTTTATSYLYAIFQQVLSGDRGKTVRFWFPSLTAISGNYIFNQYVGNIREVHFPAASREAVEASQGYSTLWGRGAGGFTVFFDL